MNRQDERTSAPCKFDPESWFPEGTVGRETRADMEYAAGICRNVCSIREACLEAAMAAEGSADAKNRYGVYGGLNPSERAVLYRRRHGTRQAVQQELAA